MPAFPATDNGDGSYAATWTPPEGGKYQIDVQVAVAGALPVAIAGAPFVATVVAADEFFGNAEVTNSWASLDSAFVDAIRKEIAQNVVWVDGCIAALEGKDPSTGGIDDVDMASQLLTIQKAIAEVNSGAEDAGKALALSAKHIAFVALETAVRARSCSVSLLRPPAPFLTPSLFPLPPSSYLSHYRATSWTRPRWRTSRSLRF